LDSSTHIFTTICRSPQCWPTNEQLENDAPVEIGQQYLTVLSTYIRQHNQLVDSDLHSLQVSTPLQPDVIGHSLQRYRHQFHEMLDTLGLAITSRGEQGLPFVSVTIPMITQRLTAVHHDTHIECLEICPFQVATCDIGYRIHSVPPILHFHYSLRCSLLELQQVCRAHHPNPDVWHNRGA
jgi:hypothetical protein